MKFWLLLPIFLIGLVAPAESPVPVGPPVETVFSGPADLFEPVWEIMNQQHGRMSNGCVGCHIQPDDTGFGPWFGDTKEDVLATLETGIAPDGTMLNLVPVDMGRNGELANYLVNGIMPIGGQHWADDQIAILFDWLITYE